MPRLKTEETTTISFRLPTRLLALVDATASHQGISRTQYILSWLPENHQRHTATPQTNGHQDTR